LSRAAHRQSAPAGASPRNRRESAVVALLIDRLADRLADRSGTRHAPPWEPKQNVLLGVLEPIWVRPSGLTTTEDSTSGDPSETGKSAEAEPATTSIGEIPSLGVDFRVRASSAEKVMLEVDIAFALYLEEIATLDEHRDYLGRQHAELKIDAGTSDGPGEDGSPSVAQPGAGGARRSNEQGLNTSAAPHADEAVAEHDEANRNGHGTKRLRERKARILGAWRRHDIAVPSFHIAVPLDGSVVTISDPLTGPVRSVVDWHYAQPHAMRPPKTRRNEIPRAAVSDETSLRAAVNAVLDKTWQPSYTELELTAFAQPLGGDEYLVSISLRNITQLTGRTVQDLSAYDCRLAVLPAAATPLVTQRFDLAPDDYRLTGLADIAGHGIGCVTIPTEAGGIRSETLPTFTQPVTESRDDHVVAPRWRDLAEDPAHILDSIQLAMREYELGFKAFVDAAAGQRHHDDARKDLKQFSDELRRFRLGRRAMRDDPRLEQAFKLANEVFARVNARASFDTWRLFQIVYIVSHLPALAAREHADAELRAELDHADVLWFPAGGGKTEAYLGLIITALFYDRLRGKHAGVTSWLRFPLRMLSVQQLSRMLRVLVIAEDLRIERGVGLASDDPFALGYLVGGTGTPNSLKWPRGWWKGWEAEAKLAANKFSEDHRDHRLVTRCPYCDREDVILALDTDTVRLAHECPACERELPLYMTDEEVYRRLPSVLISTVDKLTGYTWFPEFTAFSRGPRFRCAQHGYFSVPTQGTCTVGPDLCPAPKHGHPQARPVKDPAPALTIQDEMHLLKEELGAFSGHYEGLIAELQRGGPSGLPTKILAASATIEQYEDQLRQVYGRSPRAFPSAGYERERSFYTRTIPNARRTFVGILPHYRRKADVAAIVQAELLRAVVELEDAGNPLEALCIEPAWWESEATSDDALDLLFNYEVSLGYVNSKAHGAKLDEELGLLSDQLEAEGRGSVERAVLTGQVSIPDLAGAIDRVQGEQRSVDRAKRLRALVGTSVVSHGVDLDRLNVLVLAGMPTTAADYIQVTARSGRTHAGLVVTVYDSFSRRERSLFSNFISYHRFLDQMVTPVPVNKYAFFVADRTVPGIVLALLHDLARDPVFSGPVQGVKYAKDFQGWWQARRSAIDAAIRERLRRCYETPVAGVNDPEMERELADRAMRRWTDTEYHSLSIPAQENQTVRLFNMPPLSNFRDIDEPARFPVWYPSKEAFERLTGGLTEEDAANSPGEE
jgi:Helicase conserved C-terminal domain